MPEPRQLWRPFIPISCAIGPLTTTATAAPPVLVSAVCALKDASNSASNAATTTGKYSGRQPAMTACTAACSSVIPLPRAGMTPIRIRSSITCAAASIASTRSGVGGTIGSPSVQPFSKNVS